ncbi:MAG: integrase core domain-containing protein [Gemmatimonas sp.]|uniref:integrase core domain-containing protein n=1 Tax=Gemmatimonas sp. TaxID=1962908 RepID=UPI00391CE1B7
MSSAQARRRRSGAERPGAQGCRAPHEPASRPNTRWSIDFMRDTLTTGRVFRLFNVVGDCRHEPLAMAVFTSFPGSAVAAVLTQLVAARGRPDRIVCDNDPECITRAVAVWEAAHRVTLQHIQRGKPNPSALVESFNSRVRDECRTHYRFLSLANAQRPLAAYQHECCTARPHSALENRPPAEIAAAFTNTDRSTPSLR